MLRSLISSHRNRLVVGMLILAMITCGFEPASAKSIASGMVQDASSQQASKAAGATFGTSWLQVNFNGFGDPSNSDVMSLEVFNGQLYAGTYNWNEGGRVWRTSDGTTWTAVSDPGFGSGFTTINRGMMDMTVFNGQLYV